MENRTDITDLARPTRQGAVRTIAAMIAVLFVLVAEATECPPYPPGVTVRDTSSDRLFIAVAKAVALSESPESLEIAKAEARVKARRALTRHPGLQASMESRCGVPLTLTAAQRLPLPCSLSWR